MARLDSKPAVVLQVQRQSGENTVRVIQAIKERLPRSKALLGVEPVEEGITDEGGRMNP